MIQRFKVKNVIKTNMCKIMCEVEIYYNVYYNIMRLYYKSIIFKRRMEYEFI